jgi:hypothetical protein
VSVSHLLSVCQYNLHGKSAVQGRTGHQVPLPLQNLGLGRSEGGVITSTSAAMHGMSEIQYEVLPGLHASKGVLSCTDTLSRPAACIACPVRSLI